MPAQHALQQRRQLELLPQGDPGLVLRAFYAIGRRMFGQVRTPEKLMAHRPALMLGIGGFYGAIEWFGTIDARLRALVQLLLAWGRGARAGSSGPASRPRATGPASVAPSSSPCSPTGRVPPLPTRPARHLAGSHGKVVYSS